MRMDGKDAVTGHVRDLVAKCSHVREDYRAECGSTTLSFVSVMVPARHVWLDTDLGGNIVVDLEDWSTEERWDNAVAHVKTETAEATAELIVRWLGGSAVEDCRVPGAGRRIFSKLSAGRKCRIVATGSTLGRLVACGSLSRRDSFLHRNATAERRTAQQCGSRKWKRDFLQPYSRHLQE